MIAGCYFDNLRIIVGFHYDKNTKIKDMRLDFGYSSTNSPRIKHTTGSDFKWWYLSGYSPYNSGTSIHVSYFMAYLPSFSMEKVAYKI